MKTAIIYHPDCALHDTGGYHPERPERTQAIEKALRDNFADKDIYWLKATPAELSRIEQIHDQGYVRKVEEACLRGADQLDHGDTHVCVDSFAVARLSAGGAMLAVDEVMQGKARNAFSIMRPPGHHAEHAQAMGFCLFNNVAVAARYAQQQYALKRVAIIDIDVHHGNGTQHAFYKDGTVHFTSFHQYPFYPGTGSRSETGEGEGVGSTLNIPLVAGAEYEEYQLAWDAEVEPALKAFQPELVLISAGFDAHQDDPLANMRLRDEDFYKLTRLIKNFAAQSCAGRLVSVLEGGYNLDALARSTVEHVQSLCDGE
ncbi:histone deacetylase family protein [Cerasicoccus fimbriatus]|uniref:histone deacetylase family protein n=1 Tax=Cerasicoccus fimbriatus TaxID=3014554 RepID=UPI0022B2E685|nr:histone deacetylase [Cerasicoccus sp. TK19100]